MLSAREQFFAPSTLPASALGLGIEVVDQRSTTVYSPTTVPLTSVHGWRNGGSVFASAPSRNGNKAHSDQQLSQLQSLMANSSNGCTNGSKNKNSDEPFSNLPSRLPVDIEFKELSLTVQMGFGKGKKTGIYHIYTYLVL